MTIEIVAYRLTWPSEFAGIAADVRSVLGPVAVRIDHIGSTSVPGLPAKDVIDIEVGVGSAAMLDPAAAALAGAGYAARPFVSDHLPPGSGPDPAAWRKRLVCERPGERPANIHIRVVGSPNHRYALLFRDYLRSHDRSAEAYATLKRRLAALAADTATYSDTKDPACDLIILAAEDWAAETGWTLGPSDT